MVAKKTAAKKPSVAGSAGPAEGAKDVSGKKSAVDGKPVAAAGETAAKKTAGKRTAAKRTAARKTAAKKAAAVKEAPAGEGAARAADAGDAAEAGAASAPRTPAKKAVAKKAAARKAPAAKKQTGARTVAAKKTAGGVTTVGDGAAVPPARAGELAVRPGEDPWTPEEVAEARSGLQAEVLRLRSELVHSQEELTGLMRDSGDGAGDDQADTGSKNITREHELALAANAQEMLEQSEHALERLDAGTYGLCEVCGKPIGKARMQAFPRATLCVEDKQRQERRG
ncbi:MULTISPECIES: TraR/DksA family transcriptional regulator [unclassified Streptomyces]|uniref:TraR/DksA family transcriptional regulator n=1 Tax=unclassified Streptomyces TaxID=2593676 RepID=UPI002E784196|nr:TraR/DksA family transcriptional regulator [Streptomyces sp. SP18ES09]MEE1819197.1 TraR/DksA family transcriptional regulator [Streptomyces sp. SP18ES09]